MALRQLLCKIQGKMICRYFPVVEISCDILSNLAIFFYGNGRQITFRLTYAASKSKSYAIFQNSA